jgi:hypothetical protein
MGIRGKKGRLKENKSLQNQGREPDQINEEARKGKDKYEKTNLKKNRSKLKSEKYVTQRKQTKEIQLGHVKIKRGLIELPE